MINDGDDLDTSIFDTIIPLPYRILFLICLGHLLWYLIVFGCYKVNHMNVLQLINLSYSSHNYPQLGDISEIGEHATVNEADIQENNLLLKGVWFNLKVISLNSSISFIVYKTIQIIFTNEGDHVILKLLYHLIPLLTMLVISYKIFYRDDGKSVGKLRIFTTMKRILLGNINSVQMRTNDILISDSLVSYSKVLNDIGIFVWHYFISDEMKYNTFLELFLLCLPTLIRIRQCWNEFRLSGKVSNLLNMLKYISGILPILINFFIKSNIQGYSEDNEQGKLQHLHQLQLLNLYWYIASFINSTYSFIWDVKMDWGFGMFDWLFVNFSPKSRYLIRAKDQLIYNNLLIYCMVVVVDFILRYLWVFKIVIIHDNESAPVITKVGLFLFGYDAFLLGYCVIEVLEIFRRFIWCFFKLENDWFKLNHKVIEDIELSKLG